uniref:LIM zinc-binding domain-containing protein n=1 Tax=Oryzias latipes TaxID=8090 RepID=A0A3B3H2S2_ORYLA
MPKCPSCDKEVYFAERVSSLGKDWHRPCLKCEKCRKTLSAGSHAEHDGKPYCNNPCYSAMFGPKGKTNPLENKSISQLSKQFCFSRESSFVQPLSYRLWTWWS